MDERRLYEVGPAGTAWTTRQDPDAQARRLRQLRWLFFIGLGANACSWTLAGAALVLGGPVWGAGFGVIALLTLPLLALPGLIEAAARLRAHRRHQARPPDFPAA